jgi:hypothetical protein
LDDPGIGLEFVLAKCLQERAWFDRPHLIGFVFLVDFLKQGYSDIVGRGDPSQCHANSI